MASTDRHHENWAVLPGADGSSLAPCYDLGTCLGFQLTDGERQERLTTADGNRTVEAYAERGVSRPFQGRPRLADLAASAVRAAPPAVQAFLRTRVEAVNQVTLDALVDEVPGGILSHPARTFAVRLITINRRRLLEAMP